MSIFQSPLHNPADWSYAIESMTVPEDFRYAGYTLRALRSSHETGADLVVPADCILKKYKEDDVLYMLELQFSPFGHADFAANLPGGAPTFYMLLPDSTWFDSFEDHALMHAGDVLRSVSSVAIGMIAQDCLVTDPLLWSERIGGALTASGEDTASWQPFQAAMADAFSGSAAPVVVLDARGALVEDATLAIAVGSPPVTHTVTMLPADLGDLQRTVIRMHAANPATMPLASLWSAPGAIHLVPNLPEAQRDSFQFSCIETGLESTGNMLIEPPHRHILFTDIHSWLAPQMNAASERPRFSRGNKLTPYVNGPEFFDELFHQLYLANTTGSGFQHVGYLVKHTVDLIKKKDTDPDDLATNLQNALTRMSDGGGKICMLPAVFYQLDPDAPIEDTGIIMFFALFLGLSTLLIFYDNHVQLGIDFSRVDSVGLVIVIILLMSSFFIPIVLPALFSGSGPMYDDHGHLTFEPNKDVTEFVDELSNGTAMLSDYRAEVSDNPNANTNWLLDMGLSFVKGTGLYHQKFSVLKNPNGYMAYCGGIDLNEDRLDTEHHMAAKPYHDTHAKIEGPAVRDIARNFKQRWAFDGGTEDAFTFPELTDLGMPGGQVVQVATTYYKTADAARALTFAPQGDRTLIDTILQAIGQAREYIYIEDQYLTPPQAYRDALLARLTGPNPVRKMIIVVPEATDQPFGDIEKIAFIHDLTTADAGRGIVLIGYPRRNYNVSDNNMRTSSGRLTLMEDIPADGTQLDGTELISLGMGPRLPEPPFYFSVEGEVMYAYRGEGPSPQETLDAKTIRETTRKFYVKRGDAIKSMYTKRIAHRKGAAVTVVNYASIYVHAKTMIIDDVFLSIGSANVNRRGFFHDGEMQVFSLPQKLRNAADNPIRDLRVKLWAEMQNIPRTMAPALLKDPIAAARLFERSPILGNRFMNLKDRDGIYFLSLGAVDSWGKVILETIKSLATLPDLTYDKFYVTVVDPTTSLETP